MVAFTYSDLFFLPRKSGEDAPTFDISFPQLKMEQLGMYKKLRKVGPYYDPIHDPFKNGELWGPSKWPYKWVKKTLLEPASSSHDFVWTYRWPIQG